jgi:hypothetical protein
MRELPQVVGILPYWFACNFPRVCLLALINTFESIRGSGREICSSVAGRAGTFSVGLSPSRSVVLSGPSPPASLL